MKKLIPLLLITTLIACSTGGMVDLGLKFPDGVVPALQKIGNADEGKRALIVIQQIHVATRNALANDVNAGLIAKNSPIVSKYATYEQRFSQYWDQAAAAVDVWAALGKRDQFDSTYGTAVESLTQLQHWKALDSAPTGDPKTTLSGVKP